MSFSVDVNKWIKSTKQELGAAKRATVFELFSQVIKKTPVDTGRAKGSWQVGFNSFPAFVDEVNDSPLKTLGPKGAEVLAKITDQLGTDILASNLDYMKVLENGRIGNKGSKQAPAGMVKTTIAEFKQIAAKRGFK